VLVPGKSPVKVQPEVLDIFSLGELHVVYMDREGGGHFSSCGECDVDQFRPVSFYSPFFKPVLDCSFYEAMAGTLSVASIAVLSAKVAVCTLVRLVGLQCIVGIIIGLGRFLGVCQH
jgi:hypothetical protein